MPWLGSLLLLRVFSRKGKNKMCADEIHIWNAGDDKGRENINKKKLRINAVKYLKKALGLTFSAVT